MNEKQIITKEIFSPVVKKFERIKIVPHYKDECWSIDLIDKTSLSKYNKGYKFIFTIIDNYTKYAWAIPIKNKEGKSVTEAFKDVVKKSQRKPDKISSDRGKKFYNKTFQDYLKKEGVELFILPIQILKQFLLRDLIEHY